MTENSPSYSSHHSSSETGIYYGYVILAVSVCLMMVSWGIFYSFGVFFDALNLEFGWTRAKISGAFSICSLFSGITGIVAGKLSDRFGPRWIVTVCSLLLGGGLLLMSQADSIFEVYLIYALLIGAGMSGFWSPVASTITRWFVARRGLMTGIVVGGIGLGTVVMTTLSSKCIAVFGLKNAYLIIGVVVLVVAVVSSQFLRSSPLKTELDKYNSDFKSGDSDDSYDMNYSFKDTFRTHQFWMVIFIYFCFGISLHTILVHIVQRAIDAGIPAFTAATILSVGGGVSIIGRVAIGSASDRFGIKASMLFVIGLMSISIFWLIFSENIWMFYVFTIFHGIAYGGLSSLQAIIVTNLFGLKAAGVILGNVSFSFTLGGSIGPIFAGFIFDVTRSYSSAFLVCALLISICFVLGSFIKSIGNNRF